MEQIIILLLIFLVPGILRRLTGAGKKKAGAPPREPSRRTVVRETLDEMAAESEVDPGQQPQELPAWLRKLSEGLGEVQKQRERVESTIAETDDVSSYDDFVTAHEETQYDHSIHPEEHLQHVSRGYRTDPSAHLQQVSADLRGVSDAGSTGISEVHWRGKNRNRLPMKARPGKGGWRRAIVLSEILGPPRALKPYRSLNERDA